jgi:uncharacterized membrane protein/glutaredoxin
MRVTLYTKPDCHLCEDVLTILDRLTPQYGLEVTEVNILDDMALYEAYRHEIPVLDIEDGRLGRLKAPIDEAGLRAAFDIAGRAQQPGGSVLRPPREHFLDRMARYMGLHWLRLACIALAVFVGLPWLAPVFASLGWWDLADPIYTAYALTCHQLPERAGTVFGYQVAFCYRNTALYGGVLLFGMLYGLARDGRAASLGWLKRPVSWWGLVLLLLPMAIDGFSHMFGLRENTMDGSFGSFYIGSQPFSLNWWVRIITGLLAALGAVWFAYPRMERAVSDSEAVRLAYQLSAARAAER